MWEYDENHIERERSDSRNHSLDVFSEKIAENISYINNLKFLKNKWFIIKNYDPRFSIWIPEKLLISQLEEKWISYSLDEYWYSMRIFLPDWTVHLTQGINYGLNNTSVVKFFEDKLRTSRILKEDWFKTPKEVILQKNKSSFVSEKNNLSNVKKFIIGVWYPIIIKPNKGKKGEWVFVIHNDDELEKFYEQYNKWIYKDNIAIVQEFIKWDEIRAIYFDGEVLLGYKKEPFILQWDWTLTIKDLLKEKKLTVTLYKESQEKIEAQWYHLSQVLQKWENIKVFEHINEASDVAQEVVIKEEDQRFIKKIAESFWANYFWIDIITSGEISAWTVIEINAKPDVLWARKISPTFNELFWKKLTDYILKNTSEEEQKKQNIVKEHRKEESFECWLSKDEYYEKINSLKFLSNKEELLNNKNSIKHGIFVLLDALETDWYSYWIDEYWFVISISLPNGKNRIIYNADYWFDSSTLRRIFEDKVYTSKILRKSWKKVAEDMLVIKEKSWYSSDSNNTIACIKFAERVWYPLIFKPNDWSLGAGVKKIFTKEQLLLELEKYNKDEKSGLFLLQQYLPWKDYRILYLDWEILVSYERMPAKIKGDGKKTIKELIELNNYNEWLLKIEEYLNNQKISLSTVLPNKSEINLLPTANVATGWTVREILVNDEDKEYIKSIADIFNSRYFWIDIISNWSIADWYVLEINKAPITKWISEYSKEFKADFGKKIWQTIKKDEWL